MFSLNTIFLKTILDMKTQFSGIINTHCISARKLLRNNYDTVYNFYCTIQKDSYVPH